ncbi:DNA repair exonuclease [Rhodobacteraceae bacterium SC52]|nr:DNA repair exonuclease [Rhodobacteraceae bacterium SC52]
MPFRFIHSADLHLGRRFGAMEEDVRARLVEARHGVIGRLASAARDHGASDILIAGDLFDTETVTPRVRQQALAAMEAAQDMTWWVIPGNHDSLAAEPLWDSLRAEAPCNLRLLAEAVPVSIAPGVTLLPAPVTHRSTGVDATAWFAQAETRDGDIRLGLAHGGVQTFGSEDDRSEVIPPDRANTACLDYLALGDWHGVRSITPRCWYSGTPERDSFKHAGPGVCLAVTLPGPGLAPDVIQHPVGLFDWQQLDLTLTPEMDALAALKLALPGDTAADRRDILIRLRLAGRVRLPARAALMADLAAVRHQFWSFEVDESALSVDAQPEDLDAVAESGALRLAAEALQAESGNTALAEIDRRVAASALARLHTLLQGDRP